MVIGYRIHRRLQYQKSRKRVADPTPDPSQEPWPPYSPDKITNHCIYSILRNKIQSALVKYRTKSGFEYIFHFVCSCSAHHYARYCPTCTYNRLQQGFFSVFQYFPQALQIKFYEAQSVFLKRVISLHEHLEVIYDDGT